MTRIATHFVTFSTMISGSLKLTARTRVWIESNLQFGHVFWALPTWRNV
jgi:hypothetical protein